MRGTAEQLRGMVAAATPGPWKHRGLGVWGGEGRYEIAGWSRNTCEADFDLTALAPDAVALLADCLDALGWITSVKPVESLWRRQEDVDRIRELLSRAARLVAPEPAA